MSSIKVSLATLYQLFFGKSLVTVTYVAPAPAPTPVAPIVAQPVPVGLLTPTSKKIYEHTSPRSKPYILLDMQADDRAVNLIENQMNLSDPDYVEKTMYNGLGFFMETFVSAHCVCPVCRKPTLRKYQLSNMPVVDLVCINVGFHLATQTCFLFQVKISVTDDYFNYDTMTISTGSKAYGGIAHAATGADSIDEKVVVPGYICIRLNPAKSDTYAINNKKSFVLVPDYNATIDELYYAYVAKYSAYGANTITWNPSIVTAYKLESVCVETKVERKPYTDSIIPNPYSAYLHT